MSGMPSPEKPEESDDHLVAAYRWSIVGQDECAAIRSARLGRPVPARTLGIAGGYACWREQEPKRVEKSPRIVDDGTSGTGL